MFSTGVQKIKLSKKFHQSCVKIGECKSREEEEQIVSSWMADVKKQLGKKSLKTSQLYENVVSLIHLTLLGYNTSFGHVHAINLTQDSQMMTKALGYLSCSALLDSKSSLIIMLINSTQRDLSSQQPTAMALALTTIAHLITPDLIPPVIGYIGQCLTHTIPMIREKAVMCVHSFIQKDPSCVVEFFPELVRLLTDPDLSIVNAVINTFTMLLKNTLNIRQICECLSDIVNVCSIIQTGQARSEYYHQRMLAPFILVNIFTLFQKMSDHMPELAGEVEPVLTYALQNGTTECSATSSVLYEAIKTCIYLGLTEIPQLRGAISLFMGSSDQNHKFIGLGLLQDIPDFADEFQGVIIDCLEHPDATIRLRTLALLHCMANENNAQIIVINMLKFFQRTKNERVRTELADRITSIASQYAPSPLWFAKTMEQLFAIGGDHVKPEVAFAVLKLIDESCDEEMRRGIVNLYIDVAQSGRRLSDVFVIVIAKIIGSYAELSDEYELDFIALLLCDLADQYEAPRDWVLSALLQVIAKLEEVPAQVPDVFENYKQSKSIIVQEICFEALSLLNYHDALMCAVENEVPEDFDEQMMFLDDFVADAIENKGMKDYIPLDERDTDLIITPKTQLKFTYTSQDANAVYGAEGPKEMDGVPKPMEEVEESGLNTNGVKMVWGESGLTSEVDPSPSIAAQNYESGIAPPPEEKKVSMFQKLAIKKTQQSAEDAKKEKMKGSIFGNMKKGAAKKAAPAKPVAVDEMEKIQAPAPVPQAAPVQQGIQLTENDYVMLEQITCDINAPMPPVIQAFSQSGDVTPVYEDAVMRVAALAHDGTVLIAVMNASPTTPMMNFSIEVTGPQVFNKDIISHPKNLVAIPPQCAVWHMVTFKFPQQVSAFPDFNSFKCTIAYNGIPVTVDLPMSLISFVCPADATTPQFGALWKQGGSEIVYTMKRTADLAIDEISQALNEMVHVKTVQRIGTEEIFIGTLFSTPLKILIHVKFGAEKIDMKVLTKAPPLTQALVKLLQSVFG